MYKHSKYINIEAGLWINICNYWSKLQAHKVQNISQHWLEIGMECNSLLLKHNLQVTRIDKKYIEDITIKDTL